MSSRVLPLSTLLLVSTCAPPPLRGSTDEVMLLRDFEARVFRGARVVTVVHGAEAQLDRRGGLVTATSVDIVSRHFGVRLRAERAVGQLNAASWQLSGVVEAQGNHATLKTSALHYRGDGVIVASEALELRIDADAGTTAYQAASATWDPAGATVAALEFNAWLPIDGVWRRVSAERATYDEVSHLMSLDARVHLALDPSGASAREKPVGH